ncbi:MAG: hypothetical protein HYT21_01720 [Candidatus Nealsonbacteria bacterium]|nr:hypothetical protein [Candidatus Nealsonbacteria bacterium]
MQTWFYLAAAGAVSAVFFIFLSGMSQKRSLGVIAMFIFTLLASAAVGYGLYGAHLEAKENLGKPIIEFQEGEYEIFWIAENTQDNKVYLIAEKIENPPKQGIRFYRIDPSDPFLKKMREALGGGQGMRLKMEKNEEGELEPSIHPQPPEPLPPKSEQ